MSERHLFNLDYEEVLLDALLFSDVKHKLIQYCYPSVFYEGEYNPKSYNRILFSLIKSLEGKADALSLKYKVDQINDEELHHHYIQLIVSDNVKYWRNKYEPFAVLKILKELLFRRLTVERAEKIIKIARDNPIEHLTRDTYNEANKIITLDRKLLKGETRNAEKIARETADRINSSKDVVYTGHKFINDHFGGLTRGAISGVLALPSHMKSTLSDSIISNTVEKTGQRGLIISLEDVVEERVKRIIAPRLNLSLRAMRFKEIIVDAEDIIKVLSVTMKNRLFIYDVKDVLTPEDAAGLINDIKPDICVIDHVQKFEMSDMVIGIIRGIKTIETAAIRNDCHVIITSQVTDKKMANNKDMSKDKNIPSAGDAQWTSALRQSASEMAGIYYEYRETGNPFVQDMLIFKILKGRFGDASGKLTLQINPDRAFIGEPIV